MKKFNIEAIHKKAETIDGVLSHSGKITIGEFTETFVMAIDTWNLEEYAQQWKEGLERIQTNSTSCLVVDIRNLRKHPAIELWALYKVGSTVFISRKIRWGKIFKTVAAGKKPYYFETCYQFVEPRTTNEKGNAINAEGYELIEHKVDIQEISKFQHTSSSYD